MVSAMSSATAHAPQRTRSGLSRVRSNVPYIGAFSPALILIALVIGLPLVYTIQLSFSQWSGVGTPNFIGLDNIQDALGSSSFWRSLGHTAQFSLVATLGIILLGTLLAAAIAAEIPGWRLFRLVWFLPVVVPVSAAGVYWSAALEPGSGVVNAVLSALGSNQVAFLSSPDMVIPTLALVWVWIHSGFAMLIIAGAMNNVPTEVYEAAQVDGATSLRRFFGITLPIVRPTLVTVFLLELVFTFNGFAIVWAMTQGGPGNSSEIVAVSVYQTAFVHGDLGMASATALLGSAALAAVALLLLPLLRSRSE